MGRTFFAVWKIEEAKYNRNETIPDYEAIL